MIYVVHGKDVYYGGITFSDKLKLHLWREKSNRRNNPVANKIHISWITDSDENDKRTGRKPFIYIPANKDISDYHDLITELCLKYDVEYWEELHKAMISRLNDIQTGYPEKTHFKIDVPLLAINLHDLNVGLQKRGIKKGSFSITHTDDGLTLIINDMEG